MTDLTWIESLTEDIITDTLKQRFGNGSIYTQIGDSVLVALQAPSSSSIEDEDLSTNYVMEYKDVSLDRDRFPPHLFQFVNRAYLHMRRTGTDQSIVFRGDTESGKSYGHAMSLYHFGNLCPQKKVIKLQQANIVLESFGNAQSKQNPISSLFARHTRIQFDKRGRIVGGRVDCLFYEPRRVVSNTSNESNFAVFYQLITGCSDQERADWQLSRDPRQYAILRRCNVLLQGGNRQAERFSELRKAMAMIGLGKGTQARIMRLLACLLHLGNLQFVDNSSQHEPAYVRNDDQLIWIAEGLGIDPETLRNLFSYKTKTIRRDIITVILNAKQAAERRNDFIITLYSHLFTWLVNHINTNVSNDAKTYNTIGLLDFPGPSQSSSFDAFCSNITNERVHQHILRYFFDNEINDCRQDGIAVPDIAYQDNSLCVDLFDYPQHGLVDITNAYSIDVNDNEPLTNLLDIMSRRHNTSPFFSLQKTDTCASAFAVQHYFGQVLYDPRTFAVHNLGESHPDFVDLFIGGPGMSRTHNAFVQKLFINTLSHGNAPYQFMNNSRPHLPSYEQRHNFMEEKRADFDGHSQNYDLVLTRHRSFTDTAVSAIDSSILWVVICMRPNLNEIPTSFDTLYVKEQVKLHSLVQLSQRLRMNYTISFDHTSFCERYAQDLMAIGIDQSRPPRMQCEAVSATFGWTLSQAAIGKTKIFLRENSWLQLEDCLRIREKEEQRWRKERAFDQPVDGMSHASMGSSGDILGYTTSDFPAYRRTMAAAAAAAAGLPMPIPAHHGSLGSVYSDDGRSISSEDDTFYRRHQHETSSQFGSEAPDSSEYYEDDVKKKELPYVEETNDKTMSNDRQRWLIFVWLMTWWIPSKFLLWCGRMKQADIRMAWREKVTLCMIIFLLSSFIIWFLVFFGRLICPHQDVFSQSELQAHSHKENGYIAIRGEVFDLTKFAPRHWSPEVIPSSAILSYAGTDSTDLFPVQVSALCRGVDGNVSDYVSLDFHVNLTDPNAKYHDFRASSGDSRPDWYYEKMSYLRKNYKIGTMGFSLGDLERQATSQVEIGGIKTTRSWAILDNNVYDLTFYIMGGRHVLAPKGVQPPTNINLDFMAEPVVELFRQKSGTDITKYWDALPLDRVVRDRQEVCLRNLFFVGTRDDRNSARCIFSEYLLLIVTVFLCLVIIFKFLAALQFGTPSEPEVYDKFIICQVPCYTEGEDSLKKTIDSIAALKYDDKRKLLFLICDGMIVGGGNDRPTPRIVLDILGVDPAVDPEPLSFFSIGEGQKQHNMGKVYSGLYECYGHVVPYIVVVKTGKSSERQKPGNRGKRDSQLILMRFLNKVHFNSAMAPLELEIYHQIKNVIGVHPTYYEFILMVDADTEVMPEGLNRMVSTFVHDSKIIGLCGETVLSNEKDTWVTMIQVYEYFISHYMIKAFESLFGSVTCLPGCFSMYRLRSPARNKPLLISNQVIADYEVNRVDTLHKKNLLHLGEDRYLTTLILKHFPTHKTKFVADAKCATNAPDQWSVLLSQRRRWINSTIHNLGELVFLPQLCGFCCFSMRFVVMLDLVSTLVQPAIVGYLVYLVVNLATSVSTVPLMSIITIAGVYGLQAIIFILHRKWEHIIWMLVSIFAIPVFSFYIPLYAYWHFDDFSWGNTRVVVGEKGQKKIVAVDEGEFDPSIIPTMTWDEYEAELVKGGAVVGDEWHIPHPLDDNTSQKSDFSYASHGAHLTSPPPGVLGSHPSYIRVPSALGYPSPTGPPSVVVPHSNRLSPQASYHQTSSPSSLKHQQSGSELKY